MSFWGDFFDGLRALLGRSRLDGADKVQTDPGAPPPHTGPASGDGTRPAPTPPPPHPRPGRRSDP